MGPVLVTLLRFLTVPFYYGFMTEAWLMLLGFILMICMPTRKNNTAPDEKKHSMEKEAIKKDDKES